MQKGTQLFQLLSMDIIQLKGMKIKQDSVLKRWSHVFDRQRCNAEEGEGAKQGLLLSSLHLVMSSYSMEGHQRQNMLSEESARDKEV